MAASRGYKTSGINITIFLTHLPEISWNNRLGVHDEEGAAFSDGA
jgi:hypothetical protein